jgi:peptidoglycan/xylan/chitin deacetylase (PgdA/CDA1 family)
MVRRTYNRLAALAGAIVLAASWAAATGGARAAEGDFRVPVLVYHRFGPAVVDSMTITTAEFEAELDWLADAGATFIPLQRLVDSIGGTAARLPTRAVVVTADDGHRSVYSDMMPIVVRRGIPVTLFIYPSAISNADYAMTWAELRALVATGRFEVQSHAYWHPNFMVEKKRLPPAEYIRFVRMQLGKSRDVLKANLGVEVDLLAWPFGLYDRELIGEAMRAGYRAAVTIERRAATGRDDRFAIPRFLITDADRGAAFRRLIGAAWQDGSVK